MCQNIELISIPMREVQRGTLGGFLGLALSGGSRERVTPCRVSKGQTALGTFTIFKRHHAVWSLKSYNVLIRFSLKIVSVRKDSTLPRHTQVCRSENFRCCRSELCKVLQLRKFDEDKTISIIANVDDWDCFVGMCCLQGTETIEKKIVKKSPFLYSYCFSLAKRKSIYFCCIEICSLYISQFALAFSYKRLSFLMLSSVGGGAILLIIAIIIFLSP